MPKINWYPGHMEKTRRLLQEQLRVVDAVIELCDARAPLATRNPDLERLTRDKARILILNKADLAGDSDTARWLETFRRQGLTAMRFNSNGGKIRDILARIAEATKPVADKYAARGVKKTIRMMVVGIPNVGKSSFINRLAGDKKARVEDRPGVTRSKQWIYTPCGFQLLDTPGILWPKFEDRDVALNLAFTGAIRDDITDVESVAAALLLRLSRTHADALRARYKIEIGPDMLGYDLLEAVGRRRGFLISGGEIDTERAARIVLDEFRGAVIGKITLEMPEETR